MVGAIESRVILFKSSYGFISSTKRQNDANALTGKLNDPFVAIEERPPVIDYQRAPKCPRNAADKLNRSLGQKSLTIG
jgi:hypothetical protein